MDLAFIDLPALPLPATYAVYRATMLYVDFAGDEFMGPDWKTNLKSLRGTLEYFGKRWSVGSKWCKIERLLELKIPEHYLDLIDIALSDKQRARSVLKNDPDQAHEAQELLQDMEISRG